MSSATTPKKVLHQRQPTRIPADAGKIILEHFGLLSTGHSKFSLAEMIAPADWIEQWQQPKFDEIIIMIKGTKRIELEHETITLYPGESILIPSGTRVQYSNASNTEARYYCICLPAFDVETAHREK